MNAFGARPSDGSSNNNNSGPATRKIADTPEARAAAVKALEERLDVHMNGLVTQTDKNRLIDLAHAAVRERLAAGTYNDATARQWNRTASEFWAQAREQSRHTNPKDDPNKVIPNVIVIREGGDIGKPVGYGLLAHTRTTDGRLALHMVDAYVHPDYQESGKYGQLGMMQQLIYAVAGHLRDSHDSPEGRVERRANAQAYRAAQSGSNEHAGRATNLTPLTTYLTFNPRIDHGLTDTILKTIYGPVSPTMTGRQPQPEGRQTVPAIQLHDKPIRTTATPFTNPAPVVIQTPGKGIRTNSPRRKN